MGKGNTRQLRVKRTLVLFALTCALAAGLAATAPTAGAVITHLRHGKALSFMPLRGRTPLTFDAAFSNLDYNGGPIMPANTLYPVYWAPSGSVPYPTGYKEGINRWLKDLEVDSGGHQNTNSVAAQYGDAEGKLAAYEVHYGGELVDEDPYPANGCTQAPTCLTDAQLQAELSKFVKAHELPTDLEHMYMLLTPPKVEDCFDATGRECSAGAKEHAVYCAYHGNAPQSDGSELIYTNDPFVGEGKAAAGCDDKENHPNGISDSALIGGLSHEHNEAITDPEPNSAWTDFGGEGGESADKCRTFNEEEFGEPVGEEIVGGKEVKYNQVINGHHYWYQQEWSNQGSICLQGFTLSGTLPTATFTAKLESGDKATVDATGSTAGTGVRYNWQFNDGEPIGSPSEPTETKSLSIAHEFPEPGTYLVALTVFKPDGTSTGTARFVTVRQVVESPPAEPTPPVAPPPAPPIPTPAPPPAPALTGKIALPTTISALRNGKSKLTLTCSGTAATCTGELGLAVKRTVRVHGHRHTRMVTIATVKFTIATGHAGTVSFKLRSNGRAMLKAARGHLRALLSLKQTGPAAAKGRVGVRVNLARK